MIAVIVAMVVPAAVWYSTGLPAMPVIAVLPIAAPDHVGLADGVIAAPEIVRLKARVVPSCRVSVKFCPAAERAAVSL